MLIQIAKWGLDESDVKRLGWYETTAPYHSDGTRAICMPYYEAYDQSRAVKARTGDDYARYRVLPNRELGANTEIDKDKPKYLQYKNTGAEAYYPPNMDWEMVLNDTEIPVLITEGEAKAAKACKEGFACIGLGGVNSFRSMKNGIRLCATLQSFNWRGRAVIICFDSDICTNINVVHAANSLALTLTDYCALPEVIFVPPIEEGKVGLDDFLIANGPDIFNELLSSAVPLTAIESLIELNNRYSVIKNIACIYDHEAEKVTSRNNFVTVVEAAKKCVSYSVALDGKIKTEAVSAAATWLTWPMRNEVSGLVYEPGKELVVDGAINVWPGWGGVPKPGEVTLFNNLVDHIFGTNMDDKKWFLQWLAYPIQNPGVKMYTAAVLYSHEHGTGKSFLGQIIGLIYGKNFGEVRSADFKRDFNAWAENKQFILGDEITSSDRRIESDNLKRLITTNELRINKKYVEEYVIRDCINYMFTTNHPDAFFLEDTDRRFFIHEITANKLSDTFFSELHNWVWEEKGYEAVFDYLLNIDLTGFSPRARAKETISKVMMFEAGLGDLASWVRSVIREPDTKLKVLGATQEKDIYTAKELLRMYDPSGQTKVTSNGMTRELAKAGACMLLQGNRIPTPEGSERVYAMRNTHLWSMASAASILENVNLSQVSPRSKF